MMPTNNTIYSFGFDKRLFRVELEKVSNLVSNLVANEIDPLSIGGGDIGEPINMVEQFMQSSNFVTGSTGWRLSATGDFEGNAGTFRGTLTASSIHIPDTTTANSFHVDSDGNTWWGAITLATATATILNTGAITGSSVTITGGAISGTSLASIPNSTATDISILEKTHNIVFSVTDADTIAWSAGTIVFSNGRSFSISSGNTGNMSALTYIYLDPAVSSTVLQTTTTYSTAIGANKALIGTAQNNTVTANFIPYGGGQSLVDGSQIGALSIVAGNIAASTITANKMSVSDLSAISANIGTITSGSISVVNGGNTVALTPAGTYAFLAGPTGSPTFTVTPAGVFAASSGTFGGLSAVASTINIYTSDDTWTKPSGCTIVIVTVVGSGGGGATGNNISGGGGGGGGAITERVFAAADLPASVAVTVGASPAADTAGNFSSFGAFLIAYGGGRGILPAVGGASGGGGGGSIGAGQEGQGNADSLGGSPATVAGVNGIAGQGGGGVNNAAGRSGELGGGGGGGVTSSGAPGAGSAGGSSIVACGGGGGGGGFNDPSSSSGAAGGTIQSYTAGGGGAGGAANTNGTAGGAYQGGGGGGSRTSGNAAAGNGGNGGTPGGGGGGGGGGTSNRAGGTGGRGQVTVVTF